MSPTAQAIAAMLARRREIEGGFHFQQHAIAGASQHWLVDAVELLLRIELEQQQEPPPK
jgi:hypothetical protein